MNNLILMLLLDSIVKPMAISVGRKISQKIDGKVYSRQDFEINYGQEVFAFVKFNTETNCYESYVSTNQYYADKLNEAWFNYQRRSNIK